jgi:hypothetical protein
MTVAGPPGGLGDAGRAVEEPEEGVLPVGDWARGEDIVDEGVVGIGIVVLLFLLVLLLEER